MLLEGNGNADYAGDGTDQKSCIGTLLLLNGTPVHWCSRKQNCVSTSTTESEHVAAGSTTKDIIWYRRLLANLDYKQGQATCLFSDNQSTIRVVHNPEFHCQTKHINVVYHFIQEHQRVDDIDMQYVNTTAQLADLLTKALPFYCSFLLQNCIGLLPMPSVKPAH